MARSFRDLIDFLLAEIALCGDQGGCSLLYLYGFAVKGVVDFVCLPSVCNMELIPFYFIWISRPVFVVKTQVLIDLIICFPFVLVFFL